MSGRKEKPMGANNNNVAAMHDALAEIVFLCLKVGLSIRGDVACGIIASKARKALAAPPRNCDRFNTGDPIKDAEDAYGAWQRYCDDPTIPRSCKVESAFKYWLFASTATEREGGAK